MAEALGRRLTGARRQADQRRQQGSGGDLGRHGAESFCHRSGVLPLAAQSGNFQLNVMLPVIAFNLLQSIHLLASSSRTLADMAIKGFTVNEANLQEALSKNPILVTAMNRVIGYEKGAAIAKAAYASGRPIVDVAKEMTDLSDEQIKKLLDPAALTKGGIQEA